MLRAAYALTRQKLPLNITVNGAPAAPRDGAVRLTPDPGATAMPASPSPIAAMPACGAPPRCTGTPSAALPADANGLTPEQEHLDHVGRARRCLAACTRMTA